jgi:hypothetical protein
LDWLKIALEMRQFLLLVLFVLVDSAEAGLPNWLRAILPQQGDGTFQDGLVCYGLPYGGIGFASHIMSYWTVWCLYKSQRPTQPWKVLSGWLFDLILGSLSLLSTLAFSILAVVSCRFNWPFVLIAIWKMIFSLFMTCMAIHRALTVRRETGKQKETRKRLARVREEHRRNVQQRAEDRKEAWNLGWVPYAWKTIRWAITFDTSWTQQQPRPIDSEALGHDPAWWILLYICGVIIGLIGLIATVVNNWSDRTLAMDVICGTFGGCALLVFLVRFRTWGDGDKVVDSFGALLEALIITIGVMTALWSDWILAAIHVRDGGNWSGIPSSDATVLYWGYFAAKRLPLLFF